MSKRGKVMSILVMCLLFFISCEKIDSFIEKNSVDTEEQMESTELWEIIGVYLVLLLINMK